MDNKIAILFQFVRQDLVDRHASSVMGLSWVVIKPLSQILIFTLVFSHLMGVRLEALGMPDLGAYGYSVYLVVGLLAWLAFAQTVTRCAAAYHEHALLFNKVPLSLPLVPLYVPISEAIMYLISMALFAVFLVLIGFQWSKTWLYLPLIMLIILAMGYGLGVIIGAVSVFVRDTREVLQIFIQLGFWMTPIVYVREIVPEQWQLLFTVNPMYHAIEISRIALIAGQHPSMPRILMLAVLAATLVLVALAILRRAESEIRDSI